MAYLLPDTNVGEENEQYDTLLEKTECGEESGDRHSGSI